MNRRQRTAILFLLLMLPVPTLGTLAGLVWWPGTFLGQSLFAGSKLWLLALPLLWLRWQGQAPSWSPPRQGGLGMGALSGLGIFLAIGALYVLLGHRLVPPDEIRAMGSSTGLSSRSLYLACAAYWIGVNSVLEEYVWRWFVFARLADVVPSRWAILGSGLGFTLHHIAAVSVYLPGATACLATLGILIGAVLWSWLYARYRSIWPGYLSHVGADVAIFLIGYRILFTQAS